MKELNRTNYQTTIRPIKILQFGEGNFLRAFIDWFIQKLNDETNFNGNVAVIQPLSQGRIDAIAKQDGLYTLLLEGIQNQKLVRELKIIDVIQDYINPYTNYEQFLSYASSSDLQFIISNTTEAGIAYDENDIDDKCVSNSYPGKLLSFLKPGDVFRGRDGTEYIVCEHLLNGTAVVRKDVLGTTMTFGNDSNWANSNWRKYLNSEYMKEIGREFGEEVYQSIQSILEIRRENYSHRKIETANR